MRVALHALAPELEATLRAELPRAGHRPVDADAAEALVAGTGVLAPSSVLRLDAAGWEEAIAAARSAFRLARDTVARLLADGAEGRILFVVDPSAQRVLEGGVAGAVAGAFLTTVAEVAAVELAPRGITANVLVAGWGRSHPEALAAGVPTGRLASGADLAAACLFLLSPGAAQVNGATLAVDGGYRVTKAAGVSPLLEDDSRSDHEPNRR